MNGRDMMRILVVHNRYRTRFASGENRAVHQEIELLRSAGHEVRSYIRESDEIEGFPIREKIGLPARVVWSPRDRLGVARLAARARPDVVHVHNTFPLISPSVIHGVAALRIPIVMTLHNFRLFCANGLLFRNGRPCEDCLGSSPVPGVVHACYRGSRAATAPIALNISVHKGLATWDRVSAFVALSEFARTKVVAGGLPAERVVVKPNFAPSPEGTRDGAGERYLFLGRLSLEKGADLLVSAWSPDLGTLLVAGAGPAGPALQTRAAALGRSVRFVGQRSAAECSEMLRSARALIVPSRVYEGFPVAVAEAFAHGVPVIAPAHGAFPEIVEHGVTGRLFRPGDAADLARQVRAMSDVRRSREMGLAARRAYEARYTPERNLASLESIYELVTAGGSPSPRGRSHTRRMTPLHVR